MSMHSPSDWHRHAGTNMSQAHKTRMKATQQIGMSSRCHEDTGHNQITAYTELQTSMENKVHNSAKVIQMLQKRAASLEHSIGRTQESLAHLEAALAAKDAPLRLCGWRMDKRSKRPRREMVRDSVEVALETQRAQLVESQRKLSDSIDRTHEMIAALERKLDQVNYDTDQKKQALGVDEMCLRSTRRTLLEKAPGLAADRLPPSPGKRSPKHSVSLRETVRNEDNRVQEAGRLDQSAAQQESAAKALRDKNLKLVMLTDGIAKMAAAKAGSALQERINENQDMRSRLVASVRETQMQIEHTKGTMSDTRAELKSIEDPIKLCTSCTSARKTRATHEHIQDPVSSALQEHEMALFKSNEELRRRHQAEKSTLQELQQRMAQLQDDLKDKTMALRIDVACLTQDTIQYQFSTRPRSSSVHDATSKVAGIHSAFVPSYNFTSTAPVPLSAR